MAPVNEVYVNGQKRYTNSKGEYFETPLMANMSEGVLGWGTVQETERRQRDPGRGKGGRMPSMWEKRVPGLPPSAAFPIAGAGPKGNEVGSDADPNTPGLQGNPYSAVRYGELPASLSEDEKGLGPKGNEVGSDADPDTPGLQGNPETFPTKTVADSVQPASRQAPAPDGSGATGTNTGYKLDITAANGLLSRIGAGQLADVNSFLSEQLPTSPSEKSVAPGESLVMDDDAFTLAIQRPENDQFTEGFDWSKDASVGALRTYAKGKGFDDELVVEGVSVAGQPEQPATTSVGTADNTRSVSVPGEEEVADPQNSGTNWGVAQPKSFDRARRDAFLNGELGSMAALRAANAATGRFTQGGKRFYNVGGELQEVNEETWRKGGQKQLSADELKAGYVEGIKSTLVPADQPDVTNPDTTETNVSGDGPGISVSGSVPAPVTTVDTDSTEFNINNQVPAAAVQVEMKDNYFKKQDTEDKKQDKEDVK